MPEQQKHFAAAIINIVVSTGTETDALQQLSRVKCRRVVAMRSWVEAGIQLREFPHVDNESSRGGSARGRKPRTGGIEKKRTAAEEDWTRKRREEGGRNRERQEVMGRRVRRGSEEEGKKERKSEKAVIESFLFPSDRDLNPAPPTLGLLCFALLSPCLPLASNYYPSRLMGNPLLNYCFY